MKKIDILLQDKKSLPQPSTSTQQISEISDDDKQKVIMFFARLKLLYPGKWETTYPDARTLQLSRREWSRYIAKFSYDQLEACFFTLKRKIIEGDKRFEWPNVGATISLISDQKYSQAHNLLPRLGQFKANKELKAEVKKLMSKMLKGL